MRRHVVAVAARALLGIAGLGVLLVGVPAALAAAGWPLPTSIPPWSDVRAALGGSSISDDTIVKAIAVAGWLAWGQVLIAAAVELTAWARGRAAATVPLAAPAQALVHHLLLSILLIGSSVRSAAPPATALPVAHAAATHADMQACTPAAEALSTAAPTPTPSPPKTYVVQPRDSLWKVAERLLGDGVRWRELWDLNRDIPQPDGLALSTPDLIRPGWVLRLPDDAIGVEGDTTPATPPLLSVSPPDPGNGSDPRSPPTFPTVPTAPIAREVDGTADESESTDAGDTAPVRGPAGAGLLAAGVVATLTALRRAQVRRRRPGHVIPVPTPAAADAELRIRSLAALGCSERLDLAMRAFAACAGARRNGDPPVIQAVLVGDDIEILLAAPLEAEPGPFDVEAHGRAWTLRSSADTEIVGALSSLGAVPAPCLVAIGRIDDRDLLIDLESTAVTAVTGDPDDVDALLWLITTTLATSPLAEDVRVVMAGNVADGFDRLERAEIGADDVLSQLRADIAATRAELDAAGLRSTLDARLAGGSWTPAVVIVPREAQGPAARDLGPVRPGAGLAIVTAVAIDDADRRLSLTGDRVTVTPPGLVANIPGLPMAFRDSVGELVDLAVPDEARDAPPVVDAIDKGGGGDDREEIRPGALLVRVLGSITIEGGHDAVRRKAEELVVYLALHPDGVDEQRLKTVLWPEGLPSPHAFNQMVSRARIALGTAPDGTHYLPRLDGTTYRLGDWVTTDVHRLERAYRDARDDLSIETTDRLSDALRLVRGQPFAGVKGGYEWAHAEGMASRLEILVGEAAHLVAEWHLEHEEAPAALWAAGQGLVGCPIDEALYRDRMRAHDLAGNSAAVESVMRELCRVADAMEPYDSLHPETVELYERLTRRRVG